MDEKTKKQKILELRELGFSYNKISEIVGCSKGTISYHVGFGQKKKSSVRRQKRRKSDPFIPKIEHFLYRKSIPFYSYPINKEKRSVKSFLDKNIYLKIRSFHKTNEIKNMPASQLNFTPKQLQEKIGDNPVCYLSGRPIDIQNTRSWELDHIVPSSKGGVNDLSNCGILSAEVNRAKSDLLIPEFLKLCEDVLKYQGYLVVAPSLKEVMGEEKFEFSRPVRESVLQTDGPTNCPTHPLVID